MNAPTPEPKPKRSRRMVVWMIAVPIAILLLALAGANWKFFHLAYAKHLIASDDPMTQFKGVRMVADTHLCKGMSLEEVRRLLAPARVTELSLMYYPSPGPPLRGFDVSVKGNFQNTLPDLAFDEDNRLRAITIPGGEPVPKWSPPGR